MSACVFDDNLEAVTGVQECMSTRIHGGYARLLETIALGILQEFDRGKDTFTELVRSLMRANGFHQHAMQRAPELVRYRTNEVALLFIGIRRRPPSHLRLDSIAEGKRL